MASVRRTLSHERSYQNGRNQLFVQSPSHKLISNGKYSSPFSKFLDGFFLQNYSRKNHQSLKKLCYRCLLFFIVGFLLGLLPFGEIDDDKNPDFLFEPKQPLVNAIKEDDNFVVASVNFGVDRDAIRKGRFDFIPKKQLIIVTPTYNRALQAFYLNRMGQVLRLVPPPLIWIVVEMNLASMETAEILMNTGVMYRHIVCTKNSTNIKDRGVQQRNTALEHIEHHKLNGIVYFADDDNVYSLELFHRMREISRFGTWPVAMLAQNKAKAILEGPVCNGSQVIGWHTNEKSIRLRRFHVDMSGFAFNSTILWDPNIWKRPTKDPVWQLDSVKEGFQETKFIEQVVEDESQMEGIPQDCSEIMNWHLHLEAHDLAYPKGWLLQKNLDVFLPIK